MNVPFQACLRCCCPNENSRYSFFPECAVQALPLIVRCWSRVRPLEGIHRQPSPANEFPAPDPMPVNLSRPVRLRAKGLTDNAGLVCMHLRARVAVMLPYNVERIPVQRAWETLSAEHLQALGIDPGKCISSSTLTAAGIFMPHRIRFAFLFGAKGAPPIGGVI